VLPNPLHPAVLHFPIVQAFLLPLCAVGAMIAIRKGARPLRAWSLPLAVGAALTLSSWVAGVPARDGPPRPPAPHGARSGGHPGPSRPFAERGIRERPPPAVIPPPGRAR